MRTTAETVLRHKDAVPPCIFRGQCELVAAVYRVVLAQLAGTCKVRERTRPLGRREKSAVRRLLRHVIPKLISTSAAPAGCSTCNLCLSLWRESPYPKWALEAIAAISNGGCDESAEGCLLSGHLHRSDMQHGDVQLPLRRGLLRFSRFFKPTL